MKVKLNPGTQRRIRWLSGLVALSLLLISVTACQGYGAAPTPKTAPAPAPTLAITTPAAITISGFAFNPATITVAVGTRVTWTNRDSVAHTVTSDTNVFNSGNLATNTSFSYDFNNRGTVSYHCAIHPTMKAKVIVE